MTIDEIFSALNWRTATKQFDPDRKLDESQVEAILEAGRLAPSSFGLQLWRFVVVSDPELRQQMRAVSWDQAQVVDASHLIVLCHLDVVDESHVERFAEAIVETRGTTRDAIDGYVGMMKGFLDSKEPAFLHGWMRLQTYIALGFMMQTAAQLEIDSCPMEGFDGPQVRDILGLGDRNLFPAVLLPIGYRSLEDKYSLAPKVRYPMDEVVIRM